jgi:single-strand DNA-binding protein
MSLTINKVTIIGFLGADPDVRSTTSGRTIANLSVATTQSWRDRQSEVHHEKTEWHRIVIFSKGLVNIAQQYLKKGARVYVEGSLQTRKWQDQSGQDRYSTEIVLQGYHAQLRLVDSMNRPTAPDPGDHDAETGAPAGSEDEEIPF